jgi:triacylglycerol lipase
MARRAGAAERYVIVDSGNVPRPVVMVHGIFDTGAVFRRMSRFLERRGFDPHSPSLKPSSGRAGIDDLAHQLETYINDSLGRTSQVDLIGFSMGGLVGRYYLQRLGGAARVRRFIAISTPHHGSRMAHLLPNKACIQMRPGSAFLADLNADAHTLAQHGIASIWTRYDLMVLPAHSSRLNIGTEFTIPVLLHPLMLSDKRSLETVARLLQED